MSTPPPLPESPDYDGAHIRHILPSACAALGLEGFDNALGIPEASISVVVLADGLGDHNLARHTGHARFLGSAWRGQNTAGVLECGAPATTATSLSSFGTGKTPGQHGVTGYDVYAEHLNEVVNMLGGWHDEVDPCTWQPHQTVLQQASEASAHVVTVSRLQFKDSHLTRAALSGGEFLGANRIEDRFRAAADWIGEKRRGHGGARQGPAEKLLVYLYVDELDKTGHKTGVASQTWRNTLETLDSAARAFSTSLREEYGDQATVVLTADHGMVDIPAENHKDIAERRDLLQGVRHTAGDPRMVYLHTETGVDPHQVAERWAAEFAGSAWVLTKDQAIEAGWFGPVEEHSETRIGDVIVAANEPIAIFDTARTGADIQSMVGMHGSLTDVERRVPLLELTGRSFS